MAFGNLIGTLRGSGTAVTATNDCTTVRLSTVVAIGNLIYYLWAEESILSAITVSDNLGNSYTACNTGNDAGTIAARAFYSIVTNPGTLTSVTATTSPTSVNWCAGAGFIRGPFSIIDKTPNNTLNDLTSPFNCPVTGVLLQASEVIMQWIVTDVIASGYAETSPGFYVENLGVTGGPVGRLGARVTTATTSVTPSFTSAVNPTISIHGTTSFRRLLIHQLQAPLAASGALSCDASVFSMPVIFISADLAASGALASDTIVAFLPVNIAAQLAGSSALSPLPLQLTGKVATALAASAAFAAATASQVIPVSAAMLAGSTLAATTSQVTTWLGSSALAANAALAVAARLPARGSSAFSGSAALAPVFASRLLRHGAIPLSASAAMAAVNATQFTPSVALSPYNIGAVSVQLTVSSVMVACDVGSVSRGVLLCVQFFNSGPFPPVDVTADWDVLGTSQPMTLIDYYNPVPNTHLFMFGLVGIAPGLSKRAVVSWTTNTCDVLAQVSSWQGINQSSVAAAFSDVTHNTGTASGVGTATSITVPSVLGDVVVGQFFSKLNDIMNIGDSQLFPITTWTAPNSSSSAGVYANGAASTVLDVTQNGTSTWYAQAVNLNSAAIAIYGELASAAVGAATFATQQTMPIAAAFAGASNLIALEVIRSPQQLLAQLDGFAELSINTLRQNWNIAFARILTGQAALSASFSQITAWPIGSLFDGRGAIFNFLGQIKFIPTSAVLAAAGAIPAPRLAMPRNIAAALSTHGTMLPVAPYSFTFWAGAANLAASGNLSIDVIGRSIWQARANLAAVASKTLTPASLRLGAQAAMTSHAGANFAFVSAEARVNKFTATGSMLAYTQLSVGGTPPKALLLWDREVEPDGSPMQQVIVSNWNSAITLEADYGLIGYSMIGRGPAQRIRVIPPLVLANQELSIEQGPALLKLSPQTLSIDQSDIQQRLQWLEEYTTALAGSLSEALDRIEVLEAKLNGQGKEPC